MLTLPWSLDCAYVLDTTLLLLLLQMLDNIWEQLLLCLPGAGHKKNSSEKAGLKIPDLKFSYWNTEDNLIPHPRLRQTQAELIPDRISKGTNSLEELQIDSKIHFCFKLQVTSTEKKYYQGIKLLGAGTGYPWGIVVLLGKLLCSLGNSGGMLQLEDTGRVNDIKIPQIIDLVEAGAALSHLPAHMGAAERLWKLQRHGKDQDWALTGNSHALSIVAPLRGRSRALVLAGKSKKRIYTHLISEG